MSWFQENKFAATVGTITLAGSALLGAFGLMKVKEKNSAEENFRAAQEKAVDFEKLSLYPSQANLDAKVKALKEFSATTEALQSSFNNFRNTSATNSTPQEFASVLQKSNEEIKAELKKANVKFPDSLFLGFESYASALAKDKSTGVLTYQLGAIKTLMSEISKAELTEIKNIHRNKLAEEEGQEYKADANAAYRVLPLELTVAGSEASTRAFINALIDQKQYFYSIKNIRITNSKKAAPLTTEAKFDNAASTAKSTGFSLPGESNTPSGGDSGASVLAQIAGNETIVTFLQLEIHQFTPAKALPKL